MLGPIFLSLHDYMFNFHHFLVHSHTRNRDKEEKCRKEDPVRSKVVEHKEFWQSEQFIWASKARYDFYGGLSTASSLFFFSSSSFQKLKVLQPNWDNA